MDNICTKQEPKSKQFKSDTKESISQENSVKDIPGNSSIPNRKRIRDQQFKEYMKRLEQYIEGPPVKSPKLESTSSSTPNLEITPPNSPKFEKTPPNSPPPLYQNQLEDPEVYALYSEQYF